MMSISYMTHPSMYASFFYSIYNSNMQRINLSAFYQLGKNLEHLKTVFHNDALNDGEKWSYTTRCIEWIMSFLNNSQRVDLKDSRELAQKLLKELNDYLIILTFPPEDVLQKEFFPKMAINNFLREFEGVFEEESKRLGAFLITQKGIYHTVKLISDASEHFEPEVLKHLPSTAIYDLQEAGKCLAFECPTAMAYHILRAIEAVILKYYETLTGHAWSKKQKGWWLYIDALKTLPSNPVPPSITQRLNEIREYERNPIAHPEFILELKQAIPFFNLGCSVIPLMVDEIEKIESAKAKPTKT